jgi:hypothetical protein
MRSHRARADRSRRESLSVVYGIVAALAVERGAFAQATSEPDLATRRVLIEQAQQARAEENHGLALSRAENAQRIQSTPSLRLFVAQELLALDRPADALAQSEACVRESERDTSVPNRDALIAACRQIVSDTRSALGMVTVTVRGARPSGLSLVVASRSVDESLIGVPVAVNPGNIAIEVRADGYRVARRTIDVRRGGSEEVTVELEPEPVAPVRSPAPRARQRAVSARPAPTANGLSIGPVIAMSVGAASLVASAVTFALRQEAIAACPIENDRFVCENAGTATTLTSRADEAEALTATTQALLIAGSIVTVGGAVWLMVDRLGARPRERAGLRVAPAVGSARGVSVGGAF